MNTTAFFVRLLREQGRLLPPLNRFGPIDRVVMTALIKAIPGPGEWTGRLLWIFRFRSGGPFSPFGGGG
jgi:hypothetical protein